MQKSNSTITRTLAFAGALPFVASALLLWSGHSSVAELGSVSNIVASYGLLILSFMAGVHWGQRLSGVETSLNLFVTSNAVALAGWFSYLLLSPRLFFASLAVLFAALLMIDRRLGAEGHISSDYLRTRTSVSALVVLSLAVIALKV
jgi:ATP/ADP translocase